jgi:serine O-acetyltransferase
MRAVQVGDLIAVARVLILHEPRQWAGMAQGFLTQAHAAHAFHKRHRRPHPTWGNGSLMARANAEAFVAQPRDGDARFLAAMQVGLAAIADWRVARRTTPVSLARSRAMISSTEDQPCLTSNQNSAP